MGLLPTDTPFHSFFILVLLPSKSTIACQTVPINYLNHHISWTEANSDMKDIQECMARSPHKKITHKIKDSETQKTLNYLS